MTLRHGSARAALEALPHLAARGGARAYQVCSEAQAARELEAAERAGARLLVLGAPDYPAPLAEIPDPPPFLWALGDPAVAARPSVAVIGGRNASAVGLRLARAMAAGLGEEGYAVVSGLARGVDAAAHAASLAAGAVAVSAGGADVDYPFENADLAARIRAEGVVLSEAPMGLEPQARHFPRRNRIISGLSLAVVLIEAAERSGSLVTARFAADQGREVLAAPGAPLDPRSGGCNLLIREGATLVRDAADVIEAVRASAGPVRSDRAEASDGLADPGGAFVREGAADAGLRAEVSRLLGLAPVEEDELARLTGARLGALADALLELELAGRLDRRPGGLLALLPD